MSLDQFPRFIKNVFKRPKVLRARFFVFVSQKCEGVMQRMLKSVSRIFLSENMLRVLSFVTSHLVKRREDSFITDFE